MQGNSNWCLQQHALAILACELGDVDGHFDWSLSGQTFPCLDQTSLQLLMLVQAWSLPDLLELSGNEMQLMMAAWAAACSHNESSPM
jgi:hypothetical protein